MTRSRRSRGGHGGGGGGGGHGGGDARWLVTYADLLTLLMVLFLVLWVISTIDAKKFEKFKEGLGDFGNPAAVAAAQGETEVVNHSNSTDGEYNNTTTSSAPPGSTAPPESVDGGPGQVLDAAQLGQLAGQLQGVIDAAGLNGVVNVEMNQRGLVISVSTDNVLFQSGSAALGPEATQIISVISPDLVGIGNDVIVEGYTDKRPLHRQGYDNWDLSVDRAVSVLKLLRDTPGMSADRLAATGYGDQHPVDPGDTEEAYAKNRRVEIVVVAGTLDEVAAAGNGAAAGAGATTAEETTTTVAA
jgi:chemotaxis protein MotB